MRVLDPARPFSSSSRSTRLRLWWRLLRLSSIRSLDSVSALKPYRVDDPTGYERKVLPARVEIIQDRIDPARKTRFLEAVERALDLGKGVVAIVDPDSGQRLECSRDWTSPSTARC